MRIVAIEFLLVLVMFGVRILPAHAADQPWDRFVGCYDTIGKDGATVQPLSDLQSQIKVASSRLWTDGEGKPITSLFAFFAYDEQGSNTDLFETFTDHGLVYEQDSQVHLLFGGKAVAHGTTTTDLYYISILSESPDGQTLQYDWTGDMNVEGTHGFGHHVFSLKRVPCSH